MTNVQSWVCLSATKAAATLQKNKEKQKQPNNNEIATSSNNSTVNDKNSSNYGRAKLCTHTATYLESVADMTETTHTHKHSHIYTSSEFGA